ncbi:MAG: CapA family protein [Burkholderiales bacterium]|nr:CapA family protein [Burkholderiales bacterium]
MTEREIVLMAVGDTGPFHAPADAYAALVKPRLALADIRFAQAERLYSERGALQVHAEIPNARLKPDMAAVFGDCGFDVVSVAGNHALDWGEDAFFDTIAHLEAQGARAVGGGRNLEEARRPVVIERKGVRVAFLAYCSILNEGYAAGPRKAGVAPLRIHTYYEAVEHQPGIAPRVVTIPYDDDLADMVADIKAARKIADVVVVSQHWGLHFVPRTIAGYQETVAKAAFAAGAGLVLGHHPHVPKAIGVHDRKVCFYSLGNFIMSRPERGPEQAAAFEKHHGVKLDPEYPRLAYGTDAKRSLIARAVLSRKGVERVSFLPVLIDRQLRPECLPGGDSRFAEAVNYMEWASEDFPHTFTVDGDEVVVS